MAEALGLDIGELPEGWQPVEVLVLAKCLVPEGTADGGFPYRMSARSSGGLSTWEAAGMARCFGADAEAQYVASLGEG